MFLKHEIALCSYHSQVQLVVVTPGLISLKYCAVIMYETNWFVVTNIREETKSHLYPDWSVLVRHKPR